MCLENYSDQRFLYREIETLSTHIPEISKILTAGLQMLLFFIVLALSDTFCVVFCILEKVSCNNTSSKKKYKYFNLKLSFPGLHSLENFT